MAIRNGKESLFSLGKKLSKVHPLRHNNMQCGDGLGRLFHHASKSHCHAFLRTRLSKKVSFVEIPSRHEVKAAEMTFVDCLDQTATQATPLQAAFTRITASVNRPMTYSFLPTISCCFGVYGGGYGKNQRRLHGGSKRFVAVAIRGIYSNKMF